MSLSRRTFLRAGAVATGVLAAGPLRALVNIPRPSATYAITGPWSRGPL